MHDLHCRQSMMLNTQRPISSFDECVAVVKKEQDDPTMSSIFPSITTSNLLRRRSSTASSVYTKRVRPYPFLTPDAPPYIDIDSIMSSTPPSGSWSHSAARGGRSLTPALRNRQTPGTDPTYSLGQEFMPEAFVGHLPGPSSSAVTSSLNGAVSEPAGSTHPRHIRPTRPRGDSLYTAGDWTASPQSQQVPLGMQQHPGYPAVAGMSNIAFGTQDLSTTMQYDYTTNRNPSPDSNSSGSSSFCNTDVIYGGDQYILHRNQPSLGTRHNSVTYPPPSHQTHGSTPEEERLIAEVAHLRRRLGELEAECSRSREALEALRNPPTGNDGLPTPPPSASFQASWKARTEIRRRMFCSLNRAGNALCAWHDSRRERREFPPRNAPPGYLNCGCTHEEALFEESLARHNVGSYYPGESVRMDPALRNPLLKLLQQRYGYQDGDFERDPITGDWVEGEGPAYWEQQAHSGSVSRRRVDTERH